MNNKLYLIIALAFVTIAMSAQTDNRRTKRNPSASFAEEQIKAYEDSLRTYRLRLQEALAGNDSLMQALELNRRHPENHAMITPLTFLNGVASRLFSLDPADATQAEYDRAMAAMFIKRPDLVKDSEKNLNQSGGISFVPQQPMVQDVNFTSQSEKEYETPAEELTVIEPLELIQVRPNFWRFAGDYSLQFLQNYVSENWYKGGESSYAMIGSTTLQLNYNDKDRIKWDNKLEMKLGMQSSKGDSIHDFKSSEDLIRLTSKLGVQATRRWYYTLQMIAESQFTHGYKSNDNKVYSDFMSPFKTNLSLGMDYKVEWLKKRLTGTINISPLAANLKYYNRLNLAEAAGFDEGSHAKWDFGSTFTADLAWKFSDLIKWQTRLYAYTTYHRTEVEWENTLTFILSKYISTKVFVYPRFDDSVKSRNETYGYFQLKEYWSLGFNYTM